MCHRPFFYFIVFLTLFPPPSRSGAVTGIVIGMDHRDLFNDNGAGFAFFLINFLYGFGGLLTAYAFSFLGTDTHFPPKNILPV